MPRFLTLDDIDVARQARAAARRSQRPGQGRQGHRRDAHRAPGADHRGADRQGCEVVVMSHFGRPKGRPDPALSLRPVVAPLRQAIGGRTIAFAEDCIGEPARRGRRRSRSPARSRYSKIFASTRARRQTIADFARALAALGEVYVDDAFSAAHRAHASIAALAHLLPAAAGKLMQAELEALTARARTPVAPGDGADRRRQGLDQARPLTLHHRQGRSSWRSAGRWPIPFCLPRASASAVRCASARWRRQARLILALAERARLRRDPARGRGHRQRALAHRADAHGRRSMRCRRYDDPRHRPQDGGADRRARSTRRAPWSGTDRSAPSRRRHSTAAPWRRRQKSPNSRGRAGCAASPAAAIRWPPLPWPG